MKISLSFAQQVSVTEIYTRVKCRGLSVNGKTSTSSPPPVASASVTLRLLWASVPGIYPLVTPKVRNYDL